MEAGIQIAIFALVFLPTFWFVFFLPFMALLQWSEGQKTGFCAWCKSPEPPPCPPPIGEGSKYKSFFLHKCKKNDNESKPRPMGAGFGVGCI